MRLNLLELVQVPLDDIASFRHVKLITQPGVACQLAEGVLDPTASLINIFNFLK